MHKHLKECFNPQCKKVEEIVIIYNIFKGNQPQKEDPLSLIVYDNVKGLPKVETSCFLGKKLNNKMKETHRMITGL